MGQTVYKLVFSEVNITMVYIITLKKHPALSHRCDCAFVGLHGREGMLLRQPSTCNPPTPGIHVREDLGVLAPPVFVEKHSVERRPSRSPLQRFIRDANDKYHSPLQYTLRWHRAANASPAALTTPDVGQR